VQLSTTGGPVSFTADVGKAAWLTIAPAKGIVLTGGSISLNVTADPTNLAPAPQKSPYKAKITIKATGAATKTQVIPVTFTVIYQTPHVTGIWPPSGIVGGPATTVTLYGSNFAAATIAKIAGTPTVALKTTYYSPNIISAVIPAPQLAAGTALTIYATNPVPGSDSPDNVALTFGQTVDAAVNAASYLSGDSPGDLIPLIGQNIGPPVPAAATETVPDYVDTTLSGFTVTIGTIPLPAPILYASQNQMNVQVPYAIGLGAGQPVVVTNGTITASGLVDIAATAPGIFAIDSSGVGQAAAVNQDGTLNSSSNAAKVNTVVTLYLTGQGLYTTAIAPLDGYTIPLPSGTPPVMPVGFVMPTLTAPVTVTLGNPPVAVPAGNVTAGPFSGGMLAVLELQVKIPAATPAGAAVPIVVSIGGVDTSAQTITIAIKP